MKKKLTRSQAKNHNNQLVLRTIYDHAPISRADIARSTKLTRPTVSSQVSTLIDNQLVVEVGVGQSVGGKRPTLLDIDPAARDLICIDISNQAFRGAIMNLRGEIMHRRDRAAENAGGDEAVQILFELIDELMGLATNEILGIGVGSPGLIEPQSGLIRQAVNLNWVNLPLKKMLAERYNQPIYVANDSHLAALAEHMFGQSQKSNNVILLKLGHGIGAGIILNGRVVRGDSFSSGEIGQLVVAEKDGQLLKLEAVVGTKAILAEARSILGEPISWEMIVKSEHPEIKQLIATTGHYLGIILANLASTINIRNIFLSGRVTQFGEPLLASIRQTARRYTLPVLVDETEIAFSELGTDIVLYGCSALLLQHELGLL